MAVEDDPRFAERPPGVAVNETEETIVERPDEVVDVTVTQEEGRFSEGQESERDTPDKDVERRFSEGQERHPYSQ